MKIEKEIKIKKRLFQQLETESEDFNEEDRTVVISFASDKPVLRDFGYEIIDVNAINFERLNDKAMLLFNHDFDEYLGVIESTWVKGNKAYAKVRFDIHEKANKIFNSIKNNIMRNVSFGYEINEIESYYNINGTDAYKVSVTPFEISFVTVPADNSVGFKRSQDDNSEDVVFKIKENNNDVNNDENKENYIELNKKEGNNENINEKEKNVDKILDKQNKIYNNIDNNTNLGKEKSMDKELENEKIIETARQYNVSNETLYEFLNKRSHEEFMNEILRQRSNKSVIIDNKIEKSEKILSAASMLREYVSNNNSLNSKLHDEQQRIIDKKGIVSQKGGLVFDTRQLFRDVTVANPNSAGNLVNDIHYSNLDKDPLYDNLILAQAGAKVLNNVTGSPFFTVEKNVINAQYVLENGEATGSSLDIDKIQATPKTISANIEISRDTLLMSDRNIQTLVIDRLTEKVKQKMDAESLIGNSVNGVKGILNTTGVGSITSGGQVSWELITDMEAEVLSTNTTGLMSYVGNSKISSKLKQTQKASGTDFILNSNIVNDYQYLSTNAIPVVAGTKATSSIIFGNFNDLYILNWGTVEILIDPFSQSKKGQVSVTIFATFDVILSRPASFVVCSDIQI